MPRLLVLGDDERRAAVCARLESSTRYEVDDCDPALGDCVMYVRPEGARYAAFVFPGYEHPVTRGALAVVAERTVLVPLAQTAPDPSLDGYLFRLPRGLGFSTEKERAIVQRAIPKTASLRARSSVQASRTWNRSSDW
jgi:hypothetical protein